MPQPEKAPGEARPRGHGEHVEKAEAPAADSERARLRAAQNREAHWQRWGPYLADRQWGTVREDYSAAGDPWRHFPHDHARSRAYRWGEDGLLGICDRQCRLAFSLGLWNHRDPILKERLFGLTNPEGNHGEDVKEVYERLDATPTSSYLAARYLYPQAAFPYADLVAENGRRGRGDPEYELIDTGVLDAGRYFEIRVEYAKAAPEDIHVRIHATNHGPDPAPLDVLPQLVFRNTWSWPPRHEGVRRRPRLRRAGERVVGAAHESLGAFSLVAGPEAISEGWLFAENVSNARRLWGVAPEAEPPKDAFHHRVVGGDPRAVAAESGTKAAAWTRFSLEPGETRTLRLRLVRTARPGPADELGDAFDDVFAARIAEADRFYRRRGPGAADPEGKRLARRAYAELLWSQRFYHYVVADWLEGDPAQPPPPPERRNGPNARWQHLYNRDVLAMPDSWEYPWYAAWDLAFHALPLARLDKKEAQRQLLVMLREWYMHPSGQLPAYEFNFSDVNPPVHAWACWRVYQLSGRRAEDRRFLASAFQKLVLNFTWWVNREDEGGNNLFSGGFLGLDNIGVFDRSRPPVAGRLEQADGTAWMGFFCANMLAMPTEQRLRSVLRYVLDEGEFLSPYGVRSLSRVYGDRPQPVDVGGETRWIGYEPGESESDLFGGNSNWRGPVWFPVNLLLIEALEHYHRFYGDNFRIECPTGSGRMMNLREVADELATRLTRLFRADGNGRRPFQGDHPIYARDPLFRDQLLFHEYFHGETGRGCGASHQTGWTALLALLLESR